MAIQTWSDADRLFVQATQTLFATTPVTAFLEQNAMKRGATFNGVDGITIRSSVVKGMQKMDDANTVKVTDAETTAHTLILEQKRAMCRAIDNFKNMNINYAMELGVEISNTIKHGFIPELDAFRISTIAGMAPEGQISWSQDMTDDTFDIYKEIKRKSSMLRSVTTTSTPLICWIKTTLWDRLTESPLVKTVQLVTEVGGLKINFDVHKSGSVYFIPVSDHLMGVTFTANDTSFVSSGDLNYVMLPMESAFASVKMSKNSSGEQYQFIPTILGSTKSACQAFFLHDVFVEKGHEKYIYASASCTKPSALGTQTPIQTPAPAGMQVLGQK